MRERPDRRILDWHAPTWAWIPWRAATHPATAAAVAAAWALTIGSAVARVQPLDAGTFAAATTGAAILLAGTLAQAQCDEARRRTRSTARRTSPAESGEPRPDRKRAHRGTQQRLERAQATPGGHR